LAKAVGIDLGTTQLGCRRDDGGRPELDALAYRVEKLLGELGERGASGDGAGDEAGDEEVVDAEFTRE
jgi:hypothetical protein